MPRENYEKITAGFILSYDNLKMGKDFTRLESATTNQKMVAEITQLSHGVSEALLMNELCLAKYTRHLLQEQVLS